MVCNQWHTIQILTHFWCEKCPVCFKLYTTKTKKHETNPQWYKTNPHHTNTVLKGTKQTHTTQIQSWKNPLVVQCGHPSNVCLFQNICHLFHTIMQTFHTLGICFIPKWAFFIPCATFSYHFGIIKNVWYATCLAQYRHSFFSHLYAHFSYPWHLFHTQMTCFHTWCKIFIPICYNQNHMVCNRLA